MAIPSGACRWQGLLDVDLYSVEGRLWVIELTGLGPHGAFSTVREKRRGLHMDGLARCKLECAYGLYFGTARVRHLNPCFVHYKPSTFRCPGNAPLEL